MANESTIAVKASEIQTEVQAALGVTPTPATIITDIITLITDMINGFGSCGIPPAAATRVMNQPGYVYRTALRDKIAATIDNEFLHEPVYRACIIVGGRTTQPQVEALFHETGLHVPAPTPVPLKTTK